MNISFDNRGDQVLFRISGFEEQYRAVLEACFYQQEGHSYYKSFPKATPNLEIIQGNYLKYAPQMFDQAGYFSPVPWQRALSEFSVRMDKAGLDWWLTGSCAACIRGVPLNPHDVDIMVHSEDVEIIRALFLDHTIEPIINTQGWVTRDFGVVFLHARIDVASDPSPVLDDPEPSDCGPYALQHLEEVRWRDLVIKVPPLALQLNVNRSRNRRDRVAAIEAFIQARPQSTALS